MTIKNSIRKGITASMSVCGLFSIINHFRLAEKTFVLLYHRILCEKDPYDTYVQPGMYVECKSFDKQISILKENYQIVFLEELIEKINHGDDISRCCAITFDDGWRDNYSNAFPILKKYQVPATIFLATAFIGTNRLFWPEEICWHLQQLPMVGSNTANYYPSFLKFQREIARFSSYNRDLLLNKIIEVLKNYSPYEREAVLEYFRGVTRLPYPPRQMLNWEEADEMSKSGLIAFGAHTAEHVILNQIPISKVKDEIFRSKNDIEQNLGVKANTFAYPNGNHNERIREVLQECNFIGAVTTRKGFLGQNTRLLEIPRIGIHEDISNTASMFQGRVLLHSF